MKKKIVFFVVLVVGALIASIVLKNPLNDRVTIEAGEELPPVNVFLKDPIKNVSMLPESRGIDTNVIGEYTIKIKAGLLTYETLLTVEDTTLPILEVNNFEIWSEERLTLDDFVKNAQDNTAIDLTFEKEPDYNQVGEQEIIILAKDEGNNTIRGKSKLTIKEDLEPPRLEGVEDQEIFIGDPISYRSGVEVIDNKDEIVELIIDNSEVNLKKPGEYHVVYQAIDRSGNRTEVISKIKVNKKAPILLSDDELYERADRILDLIITEDMSTLDQLNIIWDYTTGNITYTGSSDKSHWKIGASRALLKRNGDCYNYYALAHLLLTRQGFDILPIKRIEDSPTRHYWLLVNYNDLWYHYDPTWSPLGYKYRSCMISDSEAEAYTERVSSIKENYYVYDKSLFENVDIAEKPLGSR